MWQSAAFAGALSLGRFVPTECGTTCFSSPITHHPSRLCQERLYCPDKTIRVVERDVMVAVGDLGQLDLRGVLLHFREYLRADTRAAPAFHQQRRDLDSFPERHPVQVLAGGVDGAVELVAPAAVGKLARAEAGDVADHFHRGQAVAGP